MDYFSLVIEAARMGWRIRQDGLFLYRDEKYLYHALDFVDAMEHDYENQLFWFSDKDKHVIAMSDAECI